MSRRGGLALAALLTVIILAVPAGACAAGARVIVAGTHPRWAARSSELAGRSPAMTRTLTGRVYLASRNRAGLAAFAQAVSTPGNRLYRHFLTSAQLQARFGPSAAELSAVRAWLQRNHLTVTRVSRRIGGYLAFKGSRANAATAFRVAFARYRGPDHHADLAPVRAATVPRALAAAVLAVTGLDTAKHVMRGDDTLPASGQVTFLPGPTSTFYGQQFASSAPIAYGIHQPYSLRGYTPGQLRGAYGVTGSGTTGTSQTVAVVDAYASSSMLADANAYATDVGDPPFRSGQYNQDLATTFTNTATCDPTSWFTKETLGVEAVHAMAPDANVTYVGAASCDDSDLLAALALIVDNHLASIVSDGWGKPTDQATLVSTFDEVFQAGGAEGIGFFFASGDHGYESPAEDAASETQQLDFPAESPYVTSVGGTSLAVGAYDNYDFETSWGTLSDAANAGGTAWSATPPGTFPGDYQGSGGGGTSSVFNQPAYQTGVVPSSLSTTLPNGMTATQPMRVVPDVAADANPQTGMLIGETLQQPNGSFAFTLERAGGTSLATPLWAGIEADAQQAAGHILGFANAAIYQRTATSAFHDVTDQPFGAANLGLVENSYTNPAMQQGPIITSLDSLGIDGEGASALPAVTGYDDSTGLGSPGQYIQSFAH